MKIQSLHLENYRCFSNFDIDFDPKLTVLVGVNGSGKTAVLDAVAVFLKIAMDKTSARPNPDLLESDTKVTNLDEAIRLCMEFSTCEHPEHNKRTSINCFCIPVNNTGLNPNQLLQKQRSCAKTDSCAKKGIIDLNVFRQNFSYPSQSGIPLLDSSKQLFISVYYSAQRCLPKRSEAQPKTGKTSAFTEAFNPNINFNTTLKWFDAKDAEEARTRSNNPDKKDYRNPVLKAVRDVVALALDDSENTYEFPHMDGVPPKLFVIHRATGISYEATMLSDGYRTMLAMVMDLARRMAMANEHVKWPEGQTVLHSSGIVLIDEVELHLHPSWQQTVLPKLMEIFPNAQFIVTTHSPQVLTTVAAKHIRILKDGKASSINDETEGAESWRLLKDIFGVDPRPQNIKWVKKLNEYRELVYREQWDSPDARALKQELEGHFAGTDPELMELDLHVENSKWEREL